VRALGALVGHAVTMRFGLPRVQSMSMRSNFKLTHYQVQVRWWCLSLIVAALTCCGKVFLERISCDPHRWRFLRLSCVGLSLTDFFSREKGFFKCIPCHSNKCTLRTISTSSC
jgi:hypothetical protein